MLIICILFTALALTLAWELYKKIIKNKKISENSMIGEEEPVFFTENQIALEKEIRKKWLSSYYAMAALLTLSIFNGFISTVSLGEMTKSEAVTNILFIMVFSFIATIPWCWITHHCAYKKKGTKWLLWNLISMPVAEILGFVNLPNENWNVLSLFFVGIAFTIEAYYLYNSYQLRKINLEIKNSTKVV